MKNIDNDKNSFSKLNLSDELKESLIKKQYGVFNHSGVQICSWNKKVLRGQGHCYKQEFYGVDTHRCMQFSPVVMWCEQRCTFCWRPMEYMKNVDIKFDMVDNPSDIVPALISERKKLLNGFGGYPGIDMDFLKEGMKPSHYAISLSGEPTLYPKMNEMVKFLKEMEDTKSIFIVSNGQNPSYFEGLSEDVEGQPTQLYISIDAPNKELFKKINRSMYTDGWERLMNSLDAFSKLGCRRVYRMTQIKGMNDLDEHLELYRDIIEKGKPDIIEVKAYMYLGLSRKRHTREQMPEWEDVVSFAEKLVSVDDNYEIEGKMENTLILILRRKDSKYGLKISPMENEK